MVLTPPMSTCTSMSSSPSRFSLQSTRSSHSSFSSSSHHHRRHHHNNINKTYQDGEEEEKDRDSDGDGDGEVGVGQDDAFLRLSSLLAGLQAQAEAAVSSGFISTSAPTTPLVRGFVDDKDATTTAEDGGATGISPGGPPKCSLQRTLSLPHPYLAPAPRRLRKAMTTMTPIKPVEDEDCVLITPPPPMFVSSPEGDDGMLPTPPPSLRKRGEGLMARPALSETSFDTPSPSLSPSPSPSPLLERRNSYLLSKELEIDGLLAEFLEGREKVEIMFKWVWIYLLGGGIVWAVVGWVLGWGCTECYQCPVV